MSGGGAEREFRLPDLGEGLTESEIVAWRVGEGDVVELNQVIAEVETAKALVELPSPVAGRVRALHAEPGQTVEVGATIVTFEVDAPGEDAPEPNLVGYGAKADTAGRPARRRRAAGAPTPPARPAPEPRADVVRERPRSTPPVRFLAAQLGVDLERVAGTGEDGLITREDVLAAADRTSTSREEIRVPIRGVRKATAAAMVASAFTAPHVTVFHTVDVTPTLELAARLSTEETKVSLLAMVSRAVCLGIAAHPELNSRWDEAAQEIVIFGAVNLGIAAATERGLVVPNIKGADRMGVRELSAELRALATEARAGRAAPERLSGGTFTISNIGVFGVEAGTPILNPGEAAILALGAVQKRPWEHHGGIALRDVVTLSLSFDHRVIDGEQGSRFLAAVGRMLAAPDEAALLG
jgi:pyruvate dehydrogenase E2 component (dihydrolipoamide acetyltransferase)